MKMITKAKIIINDQTISNYKISQLTGISNQILSFYKNGTRNLRKARYETIEKLAKVYDDFNKN